MQIDYVRCTWCGFEGLVSIEVDICPSCHTRGSLMDIEIEEEKEEHCVKVCYE